jgi:hypothetical protein
MMGYNINLFWNYINGKVLCKEPPEGISKSIGAMSTIPMVPDSAVCTHNNHTVHKCSQQRPNMKKIEKENKKESKQAKYF